MINKFIDRLIINANIYTLSPQLPRASVIAIHNEKIVAIGDEQLKELVTSSRQVDDLGGATVLPGFTDAHIHWQWTASAMNEIPLAYVPSKEEALNRVREAAAKAKSGEWLIGRGWAQGMWPGGAFPTAADLDNVTTQHPVYLTARSGHAAWVNSHALALAGITDSTPNPEGGVIARDTHGHATGILLEAPAMTFVHRHVPPISADQLAVLMARLQTQAWESGLTGIHDFDDQTAFEAMQILYENGELGLRVVKNINKKFIDAAIQMGLRWGYGNDWLQLGGLKLFADGALGPRTALMIDPYENEPGNYGVAVTDKEEMMELVSAASRAGLPSTIHAIGDRAVHDVLNIYEQVRKEEALRGLKPEHRRHRIEHVQLIHPNDASRLAQLGIIASMQPIHATSDYEMSDKHWGERSQWAYNARLQLNQGARVAFGSDSPIEPFEPLKGIHAAVTRRRADGAPGKDGWYPEFRLTVDEAIRGFTRGPAYTGGMEHKLGSLATGYLADLVVMGRDPYHTHPDDLLSIPIVGTMVGGKWRSGAWK